MAGYKDLYLDIFTSNKECAQAIKQFERVFEQNGNLPITFYFVKIASILLFSIERF